MAIEQNITAILRTVCDRTFGDFAPTDTERPYIVYQLIGGEVLDFIDNAPTTKANATVQVTVWADSRSSATALNKAAALALTQATTVQASALSARANDYDHDMERFSARQDFTVWADD